jgi:hypothetical protein
MRRLLRRRLLLPAVAVFAVIGPAFITANVDNDAPGIATYSVAGAHYGYTLLWILWPTLLVLLVVQEISPAWASPPSKGSRISSGRFGPRVTLWLMLALLVTNRQREAGFAAWPRAPASSASALHLRAHRRSADRRWCCANYRAVERIFLVACLVYRPIRSPASCPSSWHHWEAIGHGDIQSIPFLAMRSASLAPCHPGRFYLQATVVEKATRGRATRWRLDGIFGSIFRHHRRLRCRDGRLRRHPKSG